ncbi:MAG: SGNH/GDSL hydrolase family protein [Clostridia bacterium]|nr:SGNH/GDSL hydrolase family protein [Clostridia bacterium]
MILAKIDKNFALETSITRKDVVWFNIKNAPFEIHGLYDPKNTERFIRMPEDIAKTVSDAVWDLNHRTAGGRVRFSTDSPFVAIKALQKTMHHSPHMTHAMQNGFDLFSTRNGIYSFAGAFIPPVDSKGGFEQLRDVIGHTGKMDTYTLNFPLYGEVEDLYIGIKEGCHISSPEKYRDIKPVVYYGSSITEGGCASRPGNCYPAIISHRYNLDYINLGFSGSCKAEVPMAEYLRELDMSIFVCDYDYNASFEHLQESHYRLYEIFREKQPDTPYIMITLPNAWLFNDGIAKRKEIIFESYKKAKALGDKNVYFIDGKDLFGSDNWDNCTVDGTHPNDLGFYRMAERIGLTIKEIIERF